MKKYITTPIYYASGSPHLGHTYTTLVATCLRRYAEMADHEVLLASGTDEHGQKIEQTAARAGVPLLKFVEDRSNEFASLWKSLALPVDLFARTTEEHHQSVAVDLWQRMSANGDIDKGHYEGLYCVECEQYFTSGEICPIHRVPLQQFAEESYFFRLSAYQQRLIDHIRSHQSFIVPPARRNEVLALLTENTLRDLSISRTSTTWGIPVPGDEAHVMYVWIDALATYLSALGSLDSEQFAEYWPNTVHCIGKDILTFHAVYWPAILWSAGLTLPDSIVVNGWLTVEGRKIAKSDPTTIVDPVSLADCVTVDGLQHYFMKSVNLGHDLDFRRDILIDVVNTDLANTLGNLYARYAGLMERLYPNGFVVEARPNSRLLDEVAALVDQYVRDMESFSLTQASKCFLRIANLVNKDIQDVEPWRLPEGEAVKQYLACLHHVLRDLAILGEPFVPVLMQKARRLLGGPQVPRLADIGVWQRRVYTAESEVIFPRVEYTT
jgi:methionyl-tRNA synthetase